MKLRTFWHGVLTIVTLIICYGMFYMARLLIAAAADKMIETWTDERGEESSESSTEESFPILIDGETFTSHFESKEEADEFVENLKEATYFSSNALGLFAGGALGDIFEPRIVLSIGLVASGVSLIFYGFLPETVHFFSKPYLIVTCALIGFFGGFGWPNIVKIVIAWRPERKSLAFTMMLFALGEYSGRSLLSNHFITFEDYGFEFAFLAVGSVLVAYSFVIYFGIVESVKEMRFYVPQNGHSDEHHKHFNLNLSGYQLYLEISMFSASLLLIRMVDFELFYYNPQLYQLGTVLAGITEGALSDFIGSRSPIVGILMTISLITMIAGYSGKSDASILVTTAVGITIEGAVDLIQGVIASEIGMAATKSNNINRVGLVTGIISFFGAVGLAAGRIYGPIVFKHHGFQTTCYIFAACNSLAIIVLVKRILPDVRSFIRSAKRHFERNTASKKEDAQMAEHRF
uniref:Major facilitator superfamily (MFS) profile domain-containing protein n=1 Tax=Plectus sambesii TaxID=2011161 RepID=A0A914UZE7_9BILA